MLNIMSLACQGGNGNELARQEGNSEERRKQIFGLYVEQMFQRKGMTSLVFPKEKLIGWLSWLAGKMKEHSQSLFFVEGLQPSWLSAGAKWVAYGTAVSLSLAFIYGSIFAVSGRLSGGLSGGLTFGLSLLVGVGLGCWSELPLKNGVTSGLIGGLIYGPIFGMSWGLVGGLIAGLIDGLVAGLIGGIGAGSLNHIALVETMIWKWDQFWKRTIPGSIVGSIGGLMFGLLFGLIGGLIFGLVFGLVSGLAGGFTDRVRVDKASPNQGIKLSRKNALTTFLVTWLTVGPIFGLLWGLSAWLTGGLSGQRGGLVTGLIGGLNGGLITALFVGLNRGGSAVIKHYALRLILCLSGRTPFKFIKFLDQSASLILLKKVGGGYIFIHRMLLDYFADLTPQSTKTEDAAKTGG
jgi:eukaryotic-like serine/threonine-protein kinase